jgi:GntR family transcriptional regulator, transcriptional repressor for pyruvate dehydrogenase complex
VWAVTEPWSREIALERGPKLADRVTDEVLAMISSRELRPGDRLPAEREIGELFGVSRTVVREALRSLAAKGVLDVRSGSGARVARVGSQQASEAMRLFVETSTDTGDGVTYEQINDVRELIETRVTRLAAEAATDSDIAALRALHDQFVASRDDPERAARIDLAFHRKIADITHNPLYLVMLDSIEPTLLEIRRVTLAVRDRLDHGITAHEKILKNIATHHPHAAEQAMHEHLEESRHTWNTMTGRAKVGGSRTARSSQAPSE